MTAAGPPAITKKNHRSVRTHKITCGVVSWVEFHMARIFVFMLYQTAPSSLPATLRALPPSHRLAPRSLLPHRHYRQARRALLVWCGWPPLPLPPPRLCCLRTANSTRHFSLVAAAWENIQVVMPPPAGSVLLDERAPDLQQKEQDDARHEAKQAAAGEVQKCVKVVLLISDEHTNKSAAAMDVNVGHFCDPPDIPGLAHFCEHMLFMGTAKYPDENEYSRFLSEHGGHSNAFTGMEHTNFHFEVMPEQLHEALDRFAQFFISPLFTESSTEREIQAVDSENKKNHQSDPWRRFQLRKSTANPAHPFSKFGSGNLATLQTQPLKKGIDVRQALLKYYQEFYSASVMALCVLGREELDTLEAWVSSIFAHIPTNGRRAPHWPKDVCHPSMHAGTFSLVPIKDVRDLEMTWYLPGSDHLYDDAVCHLLPHLLGHEGPGSLLSYLKSKGWANSVSAGYTPEATCFSSVTVNCALTPEGLTHVSELARLVFQYIHMIKHVPSEQWERLWRECDQTTAMNFRFKAQENPMSFVTGLAENMQSYRPLHVIYGPYMVGRYSHQTLMEHLDLLLDPKRCRLTVTSRDFEGKTDLTEQWYGTAYSFRPTTPEEVTAWTTPDVPLQLAFPRPNLFIPTDFSLKFAQYQSEEERERGRLIAPIDVLAAAAAAEDGAGPPDKPAPGRPEEAGYYRPNKCWWKPDFSYHTPKVVGIVDYLSPVAYRNPEANLLTTLYALLVEDALNEVVYDAELAGLSYSVTPVQKGLQVIFKGYNHRIDVLVQE
eukprot:g5315.t1